MRVSVLLGALFFVQGQVSFKVQVARVQAKELGLRESVALPLYPVRPAPCSRCEGDPSAAESGHEWQPKTIACLLILC